MLTNNIRLQTVHFFLKGTVISPLKVELQYVKNSSRVTQYQVNYYTVKNLNK
jgi:hypothetical protein